MWRALCLRASRQRVVAVAACATTVCMLQAKRARAAGDEGYWRKRVQGAFKGTADAATTSMQQAADATTDVMKGAVSSASETAAAALVKAGDAASVLGEASVEKGTRLMIATGRLLKGELERAKLDGVATINVNLVVASLSTSLFVGKRAAMAYGRRGPHPFPPGELDASGQDKETHHEFNAVQKALQAGVRRVIAGLIISAKTLKQQGYTGMVSSSVNLNVMGIGLCLTLTSDVDAALQAEPTIAALT